MGKDAYYFSHDANARHDPKHVALRSKYGWQGYGWYWAIIEMMREAEGYSLPIAEPYQRHALAIVLGCTLDELEQFIEDCVTTYRLFQRNDAGQLWSESLLRRMGALEDKRNKLAVAGRKGAAKRWCSSGSIARLKPGHSHPIATDSKVKKSKEDQSKITTPPSPPPGGKGVQAHSGEQRKRAKTQSELFNSFWSAYPKKRSKGQAEKAWQKLRPDEQLVATMVATIERAKKSEEWQKEGGRYIPYPATWLNAKGWEDEVECPVGDEESVRPENLVERLERLRREAGLDGGNDGGLPF